MIVRSSCHFSRIKFVTALICYGWNQTEPDTGYSHLLACSLVAYNAAHIHLPFDDMTYNISTRHLELTVMSINCLQYSYITVFLKLTLTVTETTK